MLDKLVIHLKNIIFFKSVIYLICIILVAALIPEFRSQLLKAADKKEKARASLNQMKVQLDSTIEFEENIAKTNENYKKLLASNNQDSCQKKNDILKNILLLSKKYGLQQPIKAEITKVFENSSGRKTKEVKFDRHELNISFNVDSYAKVMSMSNEICTMLPDGSIVINMSIKKIQSLNGDIIEKLYNNPIQSPPAIIDASIKVILREIVYEQ